MRVLHVVPTYLPAWRHGGPVFAIHGLCKELANLGHRVSVFTTDVHGSGRLHVPLNESIELDGVEVVYSAIVAPKRLYRSVAMGRQLRKRVPDFDLVHLHSVFLWPTSAAARSSQRHQVPYLLAPRGMLVPDLIRRHGRLRKRLWIRLVERRTIEKAAGLHATSTKEAAALGSLGFRLPTVFHVPNGIDSEELEAHLGRAPSEGIERVCAGSPFFLFLSRLSWKKGLVRLVRALARVPDARLVVAGNDEEGLRPGLLAEAARVGAGDRIDFVGPVHGTDKATLLSRALALVLPSYSENFGNVVLESLCMGRPVVVTPEVGLSSLVAAEGVGVVVDGEPESLAPALAGLLKQPTEANEMGRRGASIVRRRYGWRAVAGEMEKVYERILDNSRRVAVRS